MPYHSTRSAARSIGTTSPVLIGLIGRDKIAPPAKDESGRYLWLPEDVERARVALSIDLRRREHRQRKEAVNA
jgi:hypothetical protein